MQKILLLLSVMGIFCFGDAFAVNQLTVWCPGYNCSSTSAYKDWCESSYKWCSVQVGSNSTYKYCVPAYGYYDSYKSGTTTVSHYYASRGIVCYSSESACRAIANKTVPWEWDGSSVYMNPATGYFATNCGTTAGTSSTDSDTSDIYTAAPGYYLPERYPMLYHSDSYSWIEDKASSCATGTYSRGATRECTTVPANSTANSNKSNFVCNSGYYGSDTHEPGTGVGGTCTACPTADSGWTRASITGSTTYSGCYEYQTPAGCSSGTVKRNASSASAYSSTVQLNSSLTAAPGYFRPGATATYCQRCPEQDGAYGTNTGAAESATECFMSSSSVLTDTSGSYSFTDLCYYCTNTCSTQSECRSLNYDTCSNGCCSGYCASGVFAASQSACVLQGYPTYTASNHCCSGSCGTATVCSTVSQCRNAGYNNSATCSSGCCSGSKCTASFGASGNTTGRCTSDSDCATDTSTYNFSCNTTTGCCERSTISSCTYGSCTSNDDCLSGTCNLLTGCCSKPSVLPKCTSGAACSATVACESPVGCKCSCGSNNKCVCLQSDLADPVEL